MFNKGTFELNLASVNVPVIVDVDKATVKPAPVAPPVKVPTEVSDDVTTVAFNVVPVNVPAGAVLEVAKEPKPDTSVLAIANKVFTCVAVKAIGVAPTPVLLPNMEFAAKLAILAKVTEAAAIVVPKLPAVVVTSPVRAGKRPLGNVPDAKFPAFKFVKLEPSPLKANVIVPLLLFVSEPVGKIIFLTSFELTLESADIDLKFEILVSILFLINSILKYT